MGKAWYAKIKSYWTEIRVRKMRHLPQMPKLKILQKFMVKKKNTPKF